MDNFILKKSVTFEVKSLYLAQVGLKFEIVLPQPPGTWVYGCIPIVPDFLNSFFTEVNLQLCSFDALFLNMWHSPFLCFLFTVSEKFLFSSVCITSLSYRHLNILIVIILKRFSTNSYISYLWAHWSVFFFNLWIILSFLKEYLIKMHVRE